MSKTKNKPKRFNLFFIIFGIILLLVSTWLDLGPIKTVSNSSHKWPDWGINILSGFSKICSSLGIAFIISWLTSFIRVRIIDEYKDMSQSQVLVQLKKIISFFGEENELLTDYKDETITKVIESNKNCRTDVVYTVHAYYDEEKKKVCTRTNMSYTEHKIEKFEKISTYSDDENMIMQSIKITVPSNQSLSKIFSKSDVKEQKLPAFQWNRKTERYVQIPEEFRELDAITVEKDWINVQEDHWICYCHSFLIPIHGVTFKLYATDGLVIKEAFIFGNDGSFAQTLSDDRKSVSIKSTNWISNNNGIVVLVAKEEE